MVAVLRLLRAETSWNGQQRNQQGEAGEGGGRDREGRDKRRGTAELEMKTKHTRAK